MGSTNPECGSGACRYINVPLDTIRDRRLSPLAKFLFAEIDTLSSNYDGCFASNDYFASLFNTTERSIRRALAQLESLDLVERLDDPDTGARYLFPKINAYHVDFGRSV